VFRPDRKVDLIKAVFFDWSNTLARYVPSREELQSQALGEFGFSITPTEIAPGIALADRYLIEEGAASPVRLRSREEQGKVFARYEQMVFDNAGVKMPVGSEIFTRFIARLNELYRNLEFALYDDVLPTLKNLKKRGLILALVTNVDADMDYILNDTGLSAFLDFIVTSGDVGYAKPNPEIFLAALKKAGVAAGEALHVGDQYDIDVLGAKAAGIMPVLLDRKDIFSDVIDCERVQSLVELARYVR